MELQNTKYSEEFFDLEVIYRKLAEETTLKLWLRRTMIKIGTKVDISEDDIFSENYI